MREFYKETDRKNRIFGGEGELGGRQTNNNDLVQAIVADRGLITALTSAILSNIDPNLKNMYSESSNSAFSSQNQPVNPRVSDDQTGMETNQVNPGVSDDQTGTESRKRAAEESADSEKHLHAKKPRGPLTLESSAQENEVDSTAFDEEFASPNSRWEASDELSNFLGTTNKRMNKFERRALVRSYPRPNIDAVYTPSMDDYLKPLIPGIMAPDKPLKDLQDNILDTFGPLCTMFENLLVMLDCLGNEGVVQLDKSSINSFLSCVKHALLLAGDASASINVNRRELVLKKINPLLASMAQEHYGTGNDNCLDLFLTQLTPNIPPTGRLKYFQPVWQRITQNPWVLQVIQGYQLELLSTPTQHLQLTFPRLTQVEQKVLDQEVQELLDKQAVHQISASDIAGFISSLFVVPKKDGGNRPVVNLKPLNQFLVYEHFKMEGIHMLRDLLRQGDYLVKIDLKDAYLTVPIWKGHQKYLRFLWKETLLEFACLPFGLAAPRVFTKLMKPVVAMLRQRGVRLIIYLDNMLIMAESTSLALHHAKSGFCCQLPQISARSKPANRVPRLSGRFSNFVTSAARRKVAKDTETVPTVAKCRRDIKYENYPNSWAS